MHYQDGTRVQIGDLARTISKNGKQFPDSEFLGIVISGNGNAEGTCNINMMGIAVRQVSPLGVSSWVPISTSYPQAATAKDCALVLAAPEEWFELRHATEDKKHLGLKGLVDTVEKITS